MAMRSGSTTSPPARQPAGLHTAHYARVASAAATMVPVTRTRQRPALHLTPPSGWLNDPYGVHWDGEQYQLFCQALPRRTTWAPGCSWARATSPDLIQWTWKGLVLEPAAFETGCWSGSVVPGHGAFYTRVAGADL